MLFFFLFLVKVDDKFSLNMLGSFRLFATKLIPVVTSVALNRHYTLQPMSNRNINWDPEKFGTAGRFILDKLNETMNMNDKKKVYQIMAYVILNKNIVFNIGYGTACDLMNKMIVTHNTNNSNYLITEKEFLDTMGFEYDLKDLDFLSAKNRGTIVTNINEILVPKVMSKINPELKVKRHANMGQINLSNQSDPDYTVENEDMILYSSDCKSLDEKAFNGKILDLEFNQEFRKLDTKTTLGFNIHVVAIKGEDFILTKEQILVIDKLFRDKAFLYSKEFLNFDIKDKNYTKFLETGNFKYLNKVSFPSMRVFSTKNFDLLEYDREKFLNLRGYVGCQEIVENVID